MRYTKSIIVSALTITVGCLFSSCNPDPINERDLFKNADNLSDILQPGDSVYHLDDFVATFMTEKGNYSNDTTPYRTRSTNGNGIYLFSIDTIPARPDGQGIYIRGRITTDDYGGNFYKSLVIQEIVGGEQQNLRISVDMGSANGMFQMGQEILIRCDGLSIGRYANQPQLCIPTYNNNIYAQNANQKVGWAPGRIPNEIFRRHVTLLGTPDISKLQCDTVTISEIFRKLSYTTSDMSLARELDGKLIAVKDVYFTSQYENNGSLAQCTEGDPSTDKNANVFAPTTGNVGYPQSRVISDGAGHYTLVSCSEYAKFAYFYLPATEYKGVVSGILSFYIDNATSVGKYGLDGYEWAITLRGVSNLGYNDVKLQNEAGDTWIPQEYVKASEQ